MRAALGCGEARQREVVELDERLQQLAAGIDLHRQPAFGEVDLHAVRAPLQAAANFGLVLVDQVLDELVARIARQPSAGYIRLNADGEITACLTGSVACRSASARYASA